MLMPFPTQPSKSAEILKDILLFQGLNEAALHHFAEKAIVLKADKGKVLFMHGDEANHFYVIVSGWVKLFRETLEGTEAVIDILTEGHVFGETSLFDDDYYGYSAQAVEATDYIVLPTSLLKYYVEKDSRMAINFIRAQAQSRKAQMYDIEHLNAQSAAQRIGCFLLRLCSPDATGKAQLHLPYDKTLIAARLGMKPETFSRALAKLKNETQLSINGASITVPSVEGLVSYTCNHCSNQFPCEDLET